MQIPVNQKVDYNRVDEINGIKFTPVRGVIYKKHHQVLFDLVKSGQWPELEAYRWLLLNDLWAIVYFVLQWPGSNHPFIINACREVQEGPQNLTVDLWGREHGKTTVITIAETIQNILKNPEQTNCILSHTRSNAITYLRSIKLILEKSELLKACFPDVLYSDPAREAEKWGEQEGIIVKRRGNSKEPTLAAFGLIEGMPTGHHYDRRVYDDVVTLDLVNTPELMERVKFAFDMSYNVGKEGGSHRVVGTPYHHEDALAYIVNKKDEEGKPLYHVRKKPTLENGDPNGKPVFLSPERVREVRTNESVFFSQHLLDPTPKADARLDPARIVLVDPIELAGKQLYKFISVDPAGVATGKTRKQDSWAIVCVGVEPVRDDIGASNIYILDAIVEPMDEATALENVVKVYKRNGRISKIGVEKVGMSVFELHIASALRANGSHVSVEGGTLELLSPRGRKKHDRILQNVQWPLNNAKIHLSMGIPTFYRDKLRAEMEKFPFAPHDDFLDAIAYAYDMMKDYRFPGQQRALDQARRAKKVARDYDPPPEIMANSWMLQ